MLRDIVAEPDPLRDIVWHTTAIDRWDNEGGAAAAATLNSGLTGLALEPVTLRDGRSALLSKT